MSHHDCYFDKLLSSWWLLGKLLGVLGGCLVGVLLRDLFFFLLLDVELVHVYQVVVDVLLHEIDLSGGTDDFEYCLLPDHMSSPCASFIPYVWVARIRTGWVVPMLVPEVLCFERSWLACLLAMQLLTSVEPIVHRC